MWTVGEIARQAGVNLETVRYYERRRLLPSPPRTHSGYRLYDQQSLKRIRFIRRAKALGYTLTEIRELLGLQIRQAGPDAKLRSKTQEKLADIELKIQSLSHIRDLLAELVQRCGSQTPSRCKCPILENLERPEDHENLPLKENYHEKHE